MKKITFFLSVVFIFIALLISYNTIAESNPDGKVTKSDCEGYYCGEDAENNLSCIFNGVSGEYCDCAWCSGVSD